MMPLAHWVNVTQVELPFNSISNWMPTANSQLEQVRRELKPLLSSVETRVKLFSLFLYSPHLQQEKSSQLHLKAPEWEGNAWQEQGCHTSRDHLSFVSSLTLLSLSCIGERRREKEGERERERETGSRLRYNHYITQSQTRERDSECRTHELWALFSFSPICFITLLMQWDSTSPASRILSVKGEVAAGHTSHAAEEEEENG